MEKYHQRHPEKAIEDQNELVNIIHGQKYMTFALCKEKEPYLVTVNYAFDQRRNCFYFHCSPKGKKMDFIRANPIVWGQIMEDRGYLQGECDHAYRTVQFKGQAEVIEDIEEKRYALHLMIEQLEDHPEPTKQKYIEEGSYTNTAIVRIQVKGMTGKASSK